MNSWRAAGVAEVGFTEAVEARISVAAVARISVAEEEARISAAATLADERHRCRGHRADHSTCRAAVGSRSENFPRQALVAARGRILATSRVPVAGVRARILATLRIGRRGFDREVEVLHPETSWIIFSI
jgi:hypothetical protein